MKIAVIILCVLHSFTLCCHNYKRSLKSQKHLAALILARGGSKGIPLKNLSQVGGQSLLNISLQAILATSGFTSVWVSTDNVFIFNEIVKISSSVNVHWRSDYTATDNATSIVAIKEFLELHSEIDKIILIQLTSPFIKVKYLQDAVNKMQHFECVFSVTRSFKLRWKKIGLKLQSLNFNIKARPRRQDWDGELLENGMFYGANRNLGMNGLIQSPK